MHNQVNDHLFRLVHVVRNVACYRALNQYKAEFQQNYWILIYNNFFDSALLEWCKVFGSNDEPTHWKTLVADHDDFRKGLLTSLGTDQAGWAAYWESVKTYRDNLVAHHQRNPDVTNYPTLDFALMSSFYYYPTLIKMFRDLGETRYPDELKPYYDRFLDQAEKFSELSYCSTKELKESEGEFNQSDTSVTK